ncbi:MAG: FkbM family methyltransferase [Halieaceae bacterium]|nr:FkbM family methyltransferase [Halieaceae bacterium]
MKYFFEKLREGMVFHYLAGALTGTVSVVDPHRSATRYRFPAISKRVVKRARRMAIKEPGTVNWIESDVRDGDVFYDIGANIGIYSLLAAARIGAGKVYSFEPDASSFAGLLQVITLNGLAGRITPLCLALDAKAGRQTFSYRELIVASTGSQLSSSPVQVDAGYYPVEIKFTQSVDGLIAARALPSPDLVKIDVDGNEMNILRGMSDLLQRRTVRSLQVEVDPQWQEPIYKFMEEAGYRLTSAFRSRQIARQYQDDAVRDHIHNAVFEPINGPAVVCD